MLKILRSTRSTKTKKSKLKVSGNSRDKVDNIKFIDKKVSDNKVGNNEVERKKIIKERLNSKNWQNFKIFQIFLLLELG